MTNRRKRQKFRKALIIASFLLFPVTIYYLSPYLIVIGASQGIITGSFIVFSALFLISLVFGRAFCGWICPAGGLQECLFLAKDKRAKGGRWDWFKYLIWLPWIAVIAVVAVGAGGFTDIDFFYQTDHGISVAAPEAYIIYYAVLLLIVVFALICGRRGFCHYTCWMAPFMIIGVKIKDILKIPSLHLTVDQSRCVHCGQCTKICSMSLPVDEMVKTGRMENSECILCAACIDNCPQSVIRYGFKGD